MPFTALYAAFNTGARAIRYWLPIIPQALIIMIFGFLFIFNIKMKSAYSNGCQTYLNMNEILPGFLTPVLLKRSCFLCEDSLKASFIDGIKVIAKMFKSNKNKYSVVYEDGTLTKGWV